MSRVVLAVIRSARPRHDPVQSMQGGGSSGSQEAPIRDIPPPPPIGRPWFLESLSTAESLIVTAISLPRFDESRSHDISARPHPHPLASAPDYILSIIAFAALYIVKAQLHVNYNTERNKFALTSRATVRAKEAVRRGLVVRLMKLLKEVAEGGGKDCLAGRYARAIKMLLSVWEASRPRDIEARGGSDKGDAGEESFQGTIDALGTEYSSARSTVGQDTLLGLQDSLGGVGGQGMGEQGQFVPSSFATIFEATGGIGNLDMGSIDPGLFDMSLYDLQLAFNPMAGFP